MVASKSAPWESVNSQSSTYKMILKQLGGPEAEKDEENNKLKEQFFSCIFTLIFLLTIPYYAVQLLLL